MSDIFQRLSECNSGMGVRNPDDYSFFMTVTEANEVSKEIAKLKAENDRLLRALAENTTPVEYKFFIEEYK